MYLNCAVGTFERWRNRRPLWADLYPRICERSHRGCAMHAGRILCAQRSLVKNGSMLFPWWYDRLHREEKEGTVGQMHVLWLELNWGSVHPIWIRPNRSQKWIILMLCFIKQNLEIYCSITLPAYQISQFKNRFCVHSISEFIVQIAWYLPKMWLPFVVIQVCYLTSSLTPVCYWVFSVWHGDVMFNPLTPFCRHMSTKGSLLFVADCKKVENICSLKYEDLHLINSSCVLSRLSSVDTPLVSRKSTFKLRAKLLFLLFLFSL